jgi:hypothetical protein
MHVVREKNFSIHVLTSSPTTAAPLVSIPAGQRSTSFRTEYCAFQSHTGRSAMVSVEEGVVFGTAGEGGRDLLCDGTSQRCSRITSRHITDRH